MNVIKCYNYGACEGVKCLYKQLKRLEQERDKLKESYKEDHAELLMARSEIEGLKSNLEEFARRADFAGKENDKLEQENKELREFCVELEKQKERQHKQWFKRCTEIGIERSQYRSALEETRVIADDTLKVCDDDCGNARKIKLIIDKINEILNKG